MYTHILTARSPFARRVRFALNLLNIEHREMLLEAQDLFPPSPLLLNYNPLGMVPTLVLPNQVAIPDSIHILAYLDAEIGALWARHNYALHMKINALISGVLTYAVREYQGLKLKSPVNDIVEDNLVQVKRCMKALHELIQKDPELLHPHYLTIWDCVTVCQYLEFRLPEYIQWKDYWPSMIQRMDDLEHHEWVKKSAPR